MTSKRKPSKKVTTTKATGKAPKAGKAATRAKRPATAAPARGSSAKGTTSPTAASPKAGRSGTKQAKLIAIMKSSDGATIDEVVKALSWQRHTVRGAIAGALKKKLGLNVTSEKIEGRGRVYRIAG